MNEFKTESKRILDLMVNSIYTHKEIFLRELISNASDAIDKLYFRSLTDSSVGISREDFAIDIAIDKQARTLVIKDNGCGMSRDELDENLGVIAHSGTLGFKQDAGQRDDLDIIGQFGVGFYASFMVSERVTVLSRPIGSEQAWLWESDGVEGYTITPAQRDGVGTTVTLHLKKNAEEERYDEFLDPYRLSGIVKKYSDYIRYPIRMDMERSRLKEGSKDEYEKVTENTTLNSMIPIWRRQKSEISPEEYNRFYKEKYFDYSDPLHVIHSSTEGSVSFQSLLFIPGKAPFNYHTKEYEKGLQLYSSGVMIMDKCADLLPDYFSFVRGLVDSPDVSLNISREVLQHDRQLRAIAKSLEKRIKNELSKLMEGDREKYESFWQSFGLSIKYGVYQDYGANKENLKDLLLFHALDSGKLVTLSEYRAAMPESQKYIYYACGESAQKIALLPQIERVRERGFDILCLTDDVDEFAVRIMHNYDEKEFKSVADADLGLETEEEKQQALEQDEEHKEMLAFIKDELSGKVSAVRLSRRLKSHPVCLTAEGGISLEMERVFEAMPMENEVKAKRVLELNPAHPVFRTLCGLYENDKERLKTYGELLYTQALLIQGRPPENPVAFANTVCELMSEQPE